MRLPGDDADAKIHLGAGWARARCCWAVSVFSLQSASLSRRSPYPLHMQMTRSCFFGAFHFHGHCFLRHSQATIFGRPLIMFSSSRGPDKLTFWGRKRKAETRCTFTKPKRNNHCSSRCALLCRTTKLHPPARTHILVHFSGKGALNSYLYNSLK
jgi:hypothetical protein